MVKAVVFDMYETLITSFESPVYFGEQIAEDAGIPKEFFLDIWRSAEKDRTTGKISLEEIIEKITKAYGCYSEEKVKMIADKRISSKKEAFDHLHPEIIPLICKLKEKGLKIGLISNCYSEEAAVIRESVLFPYFDAVCFSYEEGLKKPDPAIFDRCIRKLKVRADECLYTGDGDSNELEAAEKTGMKPVQAVWYLKEGTVHPVKRMEKYVTAERPLDIFKMIG